MSRKGLTTSYVTEEQRESLIRLDEQLDNYYYFLRNKGKDKDESSSSSSEKPQKGKVTIQKASSGNTREYRDGLRSEMVAAAERGDRRKAVGLAIALGVAQDIL